MIATSELARVANISSVISVCKFVLDPGRADMILYLVNWKNNRACFIQPRIFFQFARVDNRDSNISLPSVHSIRINIIYIYCNVYRESCTSLRHFSRYVKRSMFRSLTFSSRSTSTESGISFTFSFHAINRSEFLLFFRQFYFISASVKIPRFLHSSSFAFRKISFLIN